MESGRSSSTTLCRQPCSLISAVYLASLGTCHGIGAQPSISFVNKPSIQSKYEAFLTVPSLLKVPAPSASSVSTYIDNADSFDALYHSFSGTAHMCVLDPKYQIFVSRLGSGSLIYKIYNGVAVVAGDPLCAPAQAQALFDEFKTFLRGKHLKIIHYAASAAFAEHELKRGGVIMKFGRERVVNPLTSTFSQSKSGKRIASQCRQLLDPARAGISIGLYAPGLLGCDMALETEIQAVYDDWRWRRDNSSSAKGDAPAAAQTFITQYDLFSQREITLLLYSWGPDGRINGVAGLRCLGAKGGFQLDPCVASEFAPRGITDLLVVASMQLLKAAGISYLSLGLEPFETLQLSGQRGLWAEATMKIHRRVMTTVSAGGKKCYNDKFRPDDELASDVYIVLPKGTLHMREMMALMHVTNIKPKRLLSCWR